MLLEIDTYAFICRTEVSIRYFVRLTDEIYSQVGMVCSDEVIWSNHNNVGVRCQASNCSSSQVGSST